MDSDLERAQTSEHCYILCSLAIELHMGNMSQKILENTRAGHLCVGKKQLFVTLFPYPWGCEPEIPRERNRTEHVEIPIVNIYCDCF